MKSQPKPDCKSNDSVQTPVPLCVALVKHFQPAGLVLEPCRGDGNFYSALIRSWYEPIVDWCEIEEGRDFFEYSEKADWIITNPPFSKYAAFLSQAFDVADNIVFLVTLNHAIGLKKRLRVMTEKGFGIKEIVLLDTPPKETGWPQAGFQLGAAHYKKGWNGDIRLEDWRGKINYAA